MTLMTFKDIKGMNGALWQIIYSFILVFLCINYTVYTVSEILSLVCMPYMYVTINDLEMYFGSNAAVEVVA